MQQQMQEMQHFMKHGKIQEEEKAKLKENEKEKEEKEDGSKSKPCQGSRRFYQEQQQL
jgi:hypothetical protein